MLRSSNVVRNDKTLHVQADGKKHFRHLTEDCDYEEFVLGILKFNGVIMIQMALLTNFLLI